MPFDVKAGVRALSNETVAIRRDIHMHPELGFKEFRTAALIEKHLASCGIPTRRCAGTGVVGVLLGAKPGRTLMLRCDMDALPVTENNGLPFCSVNEGVMHACGHDCHTAVQLQTAKLLAAHRDELCGTVAFLFQPNEEELGAPQMIADGALDDPRPDAIVGLHIWSSIPSGKIGMVKGPMWASSWYFKITIHGRSTHGCLPERGISPIEAGRHVLSAIDSMQTLEYSPVDEPTLITVGSIHAGDYMNIIPDTLTMEGSVRCLHESEASVHARFRELVTAVCTAYRCTCDVQLTCGNSLVNNDAQLYETAKAAAEKAFGYGCVTETGVRGMAGDDVAEYFREGIPGFYYLVGIGDREKGTDAAHHSPDFLVDEDRLDDCVELQTRISLSYLGMECD